MPGQTRRRSKGRPRLPSAERRLQVIEVRVSASEQAQLIKRARQSGLPLSTYLRRMGLDGRIIAPPAIENIEAYRTLGRLGQLLNQALRAVHQGRARNLPPGLLLTLERRVRELALFVVDGEP